MPEMRLPSRGERAVCKRCHVVMDDCEPMGTAEFWHPREYKDGTKSKCPNAGKQFFWEYLQLVRQGKRWVTVRVNNEDTHPEIEPFMRKRTRRAIKR